MPTCVITGSNRGLGLEFVKQYAADGWEVIATCRNPDRADALNAVPGPVRVGKLDVSEFAAAAAFAAHLAATPIDVLINNAGVYGPRNATYADIDPDAWTEVLRINALAPLKLAAALVPALARSPQPRIVSVTSKMGSIAENTSGGVYIYRSSKAALNALMKSLALDLRDQGITVAVLHPGWVRTEMGGPNALIDVTESVTGMRQVIAGLGPDDAGRFFNYDGREIPW